MISGLLVLYDLHPEDLEARLMRALEKVRPLLHSHGGDVELVEFRDSVVNLRLTGSCNGCVGSTATLKSAVEQAIYEAAPEVATVIAEGAVSRTANRRGIYSACKAARRSVNCIMVPHICRFQQMWVGCNSLGDCHEESSS